MKPQSQGLFTSRQPATRSCPPPEAVKALTSRKASIPITLIKYFKATLATGLAAALLHCRVRPSAPLLRHVGEATRQTPGEHRETQSKKQCDKAKLKTNQRNKKKQKTKPPRQKGPKSPRASQPPPCLSGATQLGRGLPRRTRQPSPSPLTPVSIFS